VRGIRESFGAKLLSALLGTVGLLLAVTFIVVRGVTDRQVDAVTSGTASNAERLFETSNELRRQKVADLARPFTDGMRALQRLRAALEANDFEYLAGEVAFEMELQERRQALVVFTDAMGVPALTMVEGERYLTGDPADIQPMAERLISSDSMEARGYRVIDGTMYDVRTLYIEYGRRPVGAMAFGLPILEKDLQDMGDMGGFEGCLAHDGACVVETSGVDRALRTQMLAAIGLNEPARLESGGAEWSISAQPLVPNRPSEGYRIFAVRLEPVLAPFESILRALFIGGLGALLLSVMLGVALGRSLTRPVKELVAATDRVAAGDYHTVVSIDSKDELGTLAEAFNSMTRGLLKREQYRSVLSKVVSKDVAEELMKGEVELGGENRSISVLFADVRGFTPLTEGMEPQAVIALLNECMERLANAVDAEEGVVDKFIGDEVMAVFGAPVRQPDHALRAVTAAVRMRDDIDDLNRERASRGEGAIGIGIGVATGEAVAGNMGSSDRMNYTVLGATVNLAARLTSEAAPGEILISQATRGAAGPACIACSKGVRSLKGFSAEVDVHAVERIDRRATRSADTSVLQAL
jgi:adenylate cyclase